MSRPKFIFAISVSSSFLFFFFILINHITSLKQTHLLFLANFRKNVRSVLDGNVDEEREEFSRGKVQPPGGS